MYVRGNFLNEIKIFKTNKDFLLEQIFLLRILVHISLFSQKRFQPFRDFSQSETSANQRFGTYAPFDLKPGQGNL